VKCRSRPRQRISASIRRPATPLPHLVLGREPPTGLPEELNESARDSKKRGCPAIARTPSSCQRLITHAHHRQTTNVRGGGPVHLLDGSDNTAALSA
jgi:hypothetical protein